MLLNFSLQNIEQEDWPCTIEDSQSYYNWLESKIINIVDKLAPYKTHKARKNEYKENKKNTRLKNSKKKYLRKWRMTGRIADKQNARALNVQIRRAMLEERKQQIRRKIKPGNSITLWDAVNIHLKLNAKIYLAMVAWMKDFYGDFDLPICY